FDVMFNILNQPGYKAPKANTSTTNNSSNSSNSFNSQNSKFDLSLNGIEAGDSLYFYFEYCTKLFKEETIRRLVTYFKGIMQIISTEPDRRLAEVEIITEEEKKQILYEFNDTAAEYPRGKTIHQIFEEQVEKTPDSIGLVGSRQSTLSTPSTQSITSTPSTQSITSTPSTPKTPLQKPQSRQAHAVTYRELNEKANRL
ncbi:MAG: hypothetical protein GY757_34960, partial [bacterium]|nr:hypothetical protein [bacterium]